MATLTSATQRLMQGENLARSDADDAARAIFDGVVGDSADGSGSADGSMVCPITSVQIASFLTALSIKGESADEIIAFALAMRERMIHVDVRADIRDALVDTCGTGGDNSNTFNISTASAIIAAAAGTRIAKHGNRSVSSKCGSADALEALGVRIAEPAQVRRCIEHTGFGFIFAPYFHPCMKNVASIRKELGFRTIFNILGPLANPAGAKAQVLGVFKPDLTERMAECLFAFGCVRAMVVHSDGMDEIGLGITRITELKTQNIETYELDARDLGFASFTSAHVPRVQTSEESAKIIREVLGGATGAVSGVAIGAARDICILNAAAAIYISGKARDMQSGVKYATDAIDSGKAKAKLDEIIAYGSGNKSSVASLPQRPDAGG